MSLTLRVTDMAQSRHRTRTARFRLSSRCVLVGREDAPGRTDFALLSVLSRPTLTGHPSQLRALTLGIRSFLWQRRRARPVRGQARGGPLDARSIASILRPSATSTRDD